MSLIPPIEEYNSLKNMTPSDLEYLSKNKVEYRGKILAVVTSTNVMGTSEKSTGYELTELSRAYYVFQANGFEVDVASPLGGKPPVVIDDEDMGAYDFAFLKDSIAQGKVNHSIALVDVNPDKYEAVFFVGGKGAMFDFPENPVIQSMVKDYFQSDKVIGAVCHGPAALVNVTLDDGSPLLEGKQITSFTNREELFLIPEAATIFPFLLQDKLSERGAQFSDGYTYLENVSVDGNLVTGQNPWSTWTMAEQMIQQLGYDPKYRARTAEENAVKILYEYESEGYRQAKAIATKMGTLDPKSMNRTLIAMHSILAAMKWDIGKTVDLIRLVAHIKSIQVES
jgi:putative intracellular protease/amidase